MIKEKRIDAGVHFSVRISTDGAIFGSVPAGRTRQVRCDCLFSWLLIVSVNISEILAFNCVFDKYVLKVNYW